LAFGVVPLAYGVYSEEIPMKRKDLDSVVEEMRRLKHRIDELDDAILHKRIELDFGGKETAAIRRASMDLTRALAKLRKS